MHRIIVISLMLYSIACKQKEAKPVTPERFDGKYVRLIPDTTKMMLTQNVVISYGDLYTEADSALLEKPKQTVTIFGAGKITFQGKDIAPGENNDTMTYNKSEGTLVTN